MVAVSVRTIVCPTCNSTYRIPENKIPAKGGHATCRKCGGRIAIEGFQKDLPALRSQHPATPRLSPVPRRERVASPSDPALLEDYPELRDLASPRLDWGEIFKPKKNGRYRSGVNKYKVKVLKSIHGMLDKLLDEEERVLRVGGGIAFHPTEILFGNGYLTLLYNRYAILCTDQRALLINTDYRMKRPTHYVFQVPYQSLKKVTKSSVFGRITFKTRKGKNRTFTGIKRALVKELSLFFKDRKKEEQVDTGSLERVFENLCPSCFAPLPGGLDMCAHCEQDFKEPGKAMMRSLLLPGLGDLYLGHRFLGILEMIGSAIVWTVVILNLLEGQYAVLILLGIVNGIDALLTYHMGKKGYMLARK